MALPRAVLSLEVAVNSNSICVVGRLTRDPELKVVGSGSSVCRFAVASDYRFQKNGEWVGEPSFFDVEVWRELADNVAESLSKGDEVIVVGRMAQRSYETNGEKRTVWELKADAVGPSLRFATAAVSRTQRSGNSAAAPSSSAI